MTVTFELEKTSEREQGTNSKCPLSHVNTRLTLQNSEYLDILEDIRSSTKSPLAKCS